MRVIDTSAWIEWNVDSPLSSQIEALIPRDRAQWVVPTIIQYELAKWLARNPVQRSRGGDLLAYSTKCLVVPLTTEIAMAAARLGSEHKLAVADAIILASAKLYRADVVTCDAHFDGLPSVIYIPK